MKLIPLFALTLAAPLAAQSTRIVTTGVNGQSDSGSVYAEISGDGRWIAFQSIATNLVPNDTNGEPDVFLYDAQTGDMLRVSVDSNGVEGDDDCLEPALSLDGQVVAYFGFATNLVSGDTNGKSDVFVYDAGNGTTVRASVGTGNVESDGTSRYPSLSGDGELVAFESSGTTLVGDDTNGVRDIFVHNRTTGVTVCASRSATNDEANGDSLDAALSPDGRYVAFESDADNLVPNDNNGVMDVFVKDLQTGAIFRASVASNGDEGNGMSRNPSLSTNAERIAFSSEATNFAAADANGWEDIFVRTLATGVTERVNVSSLGGEAHGGTYEAILSEDGNFVAFTSRASNLVMGDTNGALDAFVRNMQTNATVRVSIGALGQQGNGNAHWPAISANGRFVAFDSTADGFTVGDTNGVRDIFLHDRLGPFTPYCAGDGTTATFCPCVNLGESGHGCENSAGTGGATLVASGDPADDSVRLDAAGLPPTALAIVLQGTASDPTGITFGDGVRCVTGSLKRLYVKAASGGAIFAPGPGDLSIRDQSAALNDPILAGAAREYQVYYRDPTPGFCRTLTFNATNAVRVRW